MKYLRINHTTKLTAQHNQQLNRLTTAQPTHNSLQKISAVRSQLAEVRVNVRRNVAQRQRTFIHPDGCTGDARQYPGEPARALAKAV